MTIRDWSVRRHRPRPRALGATRSVAIGLAVVGLLAGAAASADMVGIHVVAERTAVAESWQLPAQVTTAAAAAPSAAASAPPAQVPADAPTNLRIPSISVSTTLEPLGLGSGGQLDAPGYTDAGWYAGGTEPGDVGPAVIAGHYDGATKATPSVFFRLNSLKIGATIQVERAGSWLTFTVTAITSYPQDAFPTGAVYGPTPAAELRLITCGGKYSATSKSYSKNLVVFAAETKT